MPVNSHAGTQKSSGAFFSDTDGEMCLKQPLGRRSVLRASAAVRATDVMVNSPILALYHCFKNQVYPHLSGLVCSQKVCKFHMQRHLQYQQL